MKVVVGGVVLVSLAVGFGIYSTKESKQASVDANGATQITASPTSPGDRFGRAGSPNKSGSAHEYRKLASRLKALEIDVKELRIQLKEARRVQRAPRKAEGSRSDNPERRQTTAGEITAESLQREDSPVRSAVEQIVSDAIRNQRAERRELRKAFWAARDEDKLAEFAKSVDLSEKVTDQINDILLGERKKIGAQYREMRKTHDVKGGREAIRDIRDRTSEVVKGLLTTEQAEKWDEMRARRGRW